MLLQNVFIGVKQLFSDGRTIIGNHKSIGVLMRLNDIRISIDGEVKNEGTKGLITHWAHLQKTLYCAVD